MNRLFLILILTFSFQTLTNADNISDFEIDGISIGDSLLEFYTLDEIKSELKDSIFYPKSKKMKVVTFKPLTESSLYRKYDFHIKHNDKKFIIYSVKGIVKLPIKKCLKKKKEVVSEIINQVPYIKKDDYKGDYGEQYGNSLAYISDFIFKNGDTIRVWCMEWDMNNKNVITYRYYNGLAVNMSSKEQVNFIQNEAY